MTLPGIMSFIAIGCATYSLSRRYAWPPLAFTAALIVCSMPRITQLAATPGQEILPAATALFSLLLLHRLVEKPARLDLLLLALFIAYTVSPLPLGPAFPMILTLLSVVVLVRRHGRAIWWPFIRHRPITALLCLIIVILFVYHPNTDPKMNGGGSASSSADHHIVHPDNPDGIVGAAANAARYLMQSGHVTRPLDFVCFQAFGFSPVRVTQGVYDRMIFPVFGNMGSVEPFILSQKDTIPKGWFGPFAMLLIIPAMVYAAVRGHRRVKAVAVALLGYYYVVTLTLAWTPDNGCFFTLFFVCGGFLIAILLPPWRIGRRGRRALQGAATLLFAYGCALNGGIVYP